jgi:hypothetical protein
VFLVRIKTIRTKNTVMVNTKHGVGVLSKIADCVRMVFHPRAIDDPRGRFLVCATPQLCNNDGRDLSRHA